MASTLTLDRVSVGSRVRDVSLTLAAGQSVALLGRSGAGKTTLLRVINGLASPTSGTVTIDGEVLATAGLAERRRRIGTILQAPALFPHRSVFENVATVPRLLGWDPERIRASVTAILAGLGLPMDVFGARMPRSLSGGEQQRVSIARSMIAEPPLLLCDEPFSALDPIVRRELQDAFVLLRDQGDVTMLFVTHDVAEAVRVAQRIVLIDGGSVVFDAPREAFLSSDHPLVRKFIEATHVA